MRNEYDLGCGGELTGANGTLTSPNYPNRYPDYLDCEWTLMVEGNGTRMVNLTFLDFGLEFSSTCYYDYLEVGDVTVRT
jgi:hypothetical protein